MKRFMSALLAVVMAVAMCVPISALSAFGDTESQTFSVTLEGTPGHTYQVYQIFTGDYNTTTKAFANPKWGTGIDSTKYESEQGSTLDNVIAGLTGSDKETYVKTFAQTVGNSYLATPMVLAATGEDSWTATATDYTKTVDGCPAGYYMVVDVTENMPATEAYSAYMLGVSSVITIKPKNNTVPTATKTVSTDNLNFGTDPVTASIGDTVYFTLTATLPAHYSEYPGYYLAFNDTLPAGFTPQGTPVVKVGTTTIATDVNEWTTDDTSGISTLDIHWNNLQNLNVEGVTISNSTVITVTYAATLNENAVIASTGNINTMHLTYSNNPNRGTGTGGTTTTSEDKTVTVYTYSTQFAKTDGNNIVFTDLSENMHATFKLYRTNTNGTLSDQIILVKDEDSNNTYRPAVTDDEKTANAETLMHAGIVTIEGLGTGTYYLEEVDNPAGYNKLKEPITLEVKGASATVTTKTNTDGKTEYVSGGLQVINRAGTELPSTGGMGTIIFTVVGLVLVIGAGSALVIRRRVKANTTK